MAPFLIFRGMIKMSITIIKQRGRYPVPNWNSYATVQDATDYFEGRSQTDAWASYDEESQKKGLIIAADFISTEFQYRGSPAFGELDPVHPQFGPFPRDGLYDERGSSQYETPIGVVRANCELAYWVNYLNFNLYVNQENLITGSPVAESVTKTVGPLTKKYQYSNPYAQLTRVPVYEKVCSWLKPYLAPSGRLVRVGS